MTVESIKPLLINYVNRSAHVKCLEWDHQLSQKLLFNPYSDTEYDKRKIAHYFLLVASITETKLIGNAENSRELMIHFHRILQDGFFQIEEASILAEIMNKFIGEIVKLGPLFPIKSKDIEAEGAKTASVEINGGG